MGITCSLLGHRFGETTVEREREEQGSEVVTTITEFETCARCGQTRVVSENTEVTTLAVPDESAGEDGDDTSPVDDAPGTDGTSEPAPGDLDPDEDDGVILGGNTDTGAAGTAVADAEDDGTTTSGRVDDGSAGEQTAGADDEPVEPEDDAVIIDGDADSGTAGDETVTETGPDEGAAGWGSEDGTPADGSAGASDSATPSPDPAPADDGPGPGAEWPEETRPDTDEDALGGPALEESASPTVTVPEGMFKCSECGFETEVAASSLRAGDFCPECYTGTLVQHDDGNGN